VGNPRQTRHSILAEYAADRAREWLLRKFSERVREELQDMLRLCDRVCSEPPFWRDEVGYYAASEASLARKLAGGTSWHRRILWLYDHGRDDEELLLIRDEASCRFEPEQVETRYQSWPGSSFG
jgi:hypothetical protein